MVWQLRGEVAWRDFVGRSGALAIASATAGTSAIAHNLGGGHTPPWAAVMVVFALTWWTTVPVLRALTNRPRCATLGLATWLAVLQFATHLMWTAWNSEAVITGHRHSEHHVAVGQHTNTHTSAHAASHEWGWPMLAAHAIGVLSCAVLAGLLTQLAHATRTFVETCCTTAPSLPVLAPRRTSLNPPLTWTLSTHLGFPPTLRRGPPAASLVVLFA